MNRLPTVFHITHHKAGSQWVAEVLKHCAGARVMLPQPMMEQVRIRPIMPGGVYLTVYLDRTKFEMLLGVQGVSARALIRHPVVSLVNWWTFRLWKAPYRCVYVVRDLRDTLVSMYFSYKTSHPLMARLPKIRPELERLTQEDGFLYLMQVRLKVIATIQQSWVQAPGLHVSFEQLIADEHTAFERIIEYCQIKIDRQRLHEIVQYNSFEYITGRQRGQEDVNAHQRKGIVGDWRNYFTPRIKDAFKEQFGHVLIQTGYEQNLEW